MTREDRFSKALDQYMEDGIEPRLEEEDMELFELSKELLNMKKRETKKNKFGSMKKVAALALVGAIGFTSIQTGFAQEVIDRIFNLKYVSVIEEKDGELPDEVLLQMFDKDGRQLEEVFEDTPIYDKDGNILTEVEYRGKKISIVKNQDSDENILNLDKIEDLEGRLDFEPKLPSYLPSGYEFERAELILGEDGQASREYLSLIYSNGRKSFVISERLATEANKFESGASKVEELELGSNRALLSDGKTLDMEVGDTIVSILTKKAITRDEIIKIGESLVK